MDMLRLVHKVKFEVHGMIFENALSFHWRGVSHSRFYVRTQRCCISEVML